MLQCGGSDLEEGNANYAAGQFTKAVNNYKAFKKDNPENKEIDARITLAYFSKGKQLYDKTHKIEPFSGNFEKGQEYLPQEWPTLELQNQYSDLLYELALAYNTVKPENSVQEEEFFNNTLEYLDQALMFNPDNNKANDKLAEIREANFQNMFDKGMKKLKEAQKSKNADALYISAEWYFNKAVEFSGGNEEAEKYLNKARKGSIVSLGTRTPLDFCVPSYQILKDVLYISFAVINNSDKDISLDLNSLVLTTTAGEEVKADQKKTAELEAAITNKLNLAPFKFEQGAIAFPLKKGAKLAKLSYKISDKLSIVKYFPL